MNTVKSPLASHVTLIRISYFSGCDYAVLIMYSYEIYGMNFTLGG